MSVKEKRKICVVITARPSYSRIKSVLQAIVDHPNLELQLVVAGSALLNRYGNTIKIIEGDGFEVSDRVFMVLEGETPTSMAKTTGIGVMELADTFFKLRPDAVITIADRFETIATSIAASYQNIPLVHIQGGEVTGNIDEKVRHANTKLADVHFVSSEDARMRVVKMGENEDFVFNTGCPSIDIAADVLNAGPLNFDPLAKYGGVGNITEAPEEYIVVMQHPVTTEYSLAREHINCTIDAVRALNIPTYWFWPNVDAGADGTSNAIRSFRENHNPKHVQFFKNMEPTDFLHLLNNSKCLIGNSSVGIRECAFMGVPVVNIGTRQHQRMRGANVIDVDYNAEQIGNAIRKQCDHGHFDSEDIYGDGTSGKKIADLLATSELHFHKTITY